jgi:hypothetical protein
MNNVNYLLQIKQWNCPHCKKKFSSAASVKGGHIVNCKDNPEKTKRGKSISLCWEKQRLIYQEDGRQKVKENDPLYIAGCMLYWGIGVKYKEKFCISKSESDIVTLQFFIKFLKKFWTHDDKIKCCIYVQNLNFFSRDEIIDFWSKSLNLSNVEIFDNKKISGDKASRHTPNHGICQIRVNDVKIIQEIYGAIQELGEFTEDKWLK